MAKKKRKKKAPVRYDRGTVAENRVECVLQHMQEQGEITTFSRYARLSLRDLDGVDFSVYVRGKKDFNIQVKSSKSGVINYRKKYKGRDILLLIGYDPLDKIRLDILDYINEPEKLLQN